MKSHFNLKNVAVSLNFNLEIPFLLLAFLYLNVAW